MSDDNTDDVPEKYEKNGHRKSMNATDWVAAYFREAEVETVGTSTDQTAGSTPGDDSVRIIEVTGADEKTGAWTDRDKIPGWIDVDLDLPVTTTDVMHRYDRGK